MNTNELTQVQAEFRSAMAQLSASVNVITTSGPHGQVGLTATAVCSVSDSPPTVLVCINRKSATRDIFLANGRLCVNVLNSNQEDVALDFAGITGIPMHQRFSSPHWENPTDSEDQPRLREAMVTLEGRIASTVEMGSHTVMFVEADRINSQEDHGGLVYFQRRFLPVEPSVESLV